MQPQPTLMSDRELWIAAPSNSHLRPGSRQETAANQGIWPNPLSRFAAIVLQQSAEPLLTANVAQRTK